MSPLRMLARPMLASVFLRDALDALRHPDQHVEQLRECSPADRICQRNPAVAANLRTITRAHAGLTLVAGAMFSIGKAPRTSATVLALTALPATMVAHPVRSKDQRKQHLPTLLNRGGLIAGLFFAATDRAGEPSLAWRVSSWRQDRAERSHASDQQD